MFRLLSLSEILLLIEKLRFLSCPHCGKQGALGRHGFLRGFISPSRRGIRGYRVRCRPDRDGCGRTFSLRPACSILRCCFSSQQIWSFIRELFKHRSIKAAWEASGIPLSLDTGYRLYHRLVRIQPVLRTALSGRDPPPEKIRAASPLLSTLFHLVAEFGKDDPVSAFQASLHRDFLAEA